MKTLHNIDLTPEEYVSPVLLLRRVARQTGIAEGDIRHVEVLRSSLDSRRGSSYHATVEAYVGDDFSPRDYSGNSTD